MLWSSLQSNERGKTVEYTFSFNREGAIVYQVAITKIAEKQLNKLPFKIRANITSAIIGLKTWQGNIIKLSVSRNEYRLRVGRYRVLFLVENNTIFIAGIDDRKDIYRKRR